MTGFMLEVLNNWLMLAGTSFLLTLGFANATAPWSRTVGMLCFWQVLMGAAGGFYDTGLFARSHGL